MNLEWFPLDRRNTDSHLTDQTLLDHVFEITIDTANPPR